MAFPLCLSPVLLAFLTGAQDQPGNNLLNDLRAMQFPPSGPAIPGGFGAGGLNQNFGGMGMAGGGAQSTFGSVASAPPGLGAQVPETPPDFACTTGANAAAWDSVKRRFRALFDGNAGGSPFVLGNREAMSATLEGALRDLKAVNALGPNAVDECGLGKLSLQLVSFATVDDPMALIQLFSSLEQLASPVLTLLLDVPWEAVAESRWPLFGLLSHLNLRKSHIQGALNTDAIDGLEDMNAKVFQAELVNALQTGNAAALGNSAGTFLQNYGKDSALGPLTALSAQAMSSTDPQIIPVIQMGFKQAIGSAAELDVATSTQWPLWGLLHVVVDRLG